MGNFHPMEVIPTTQKKIPDCVSYYSYNIITMSMNKISLAQWRTKIYKGKNVMVLYESHHEKLFVPFHGNIIKMYHDWVY
jgi:hypothetical protein